MIGDKYDEQQSLPTAEFVEDLFKTMRELALTEMAHHATPKVQVPSSIETADFVYIRTDSVRQPLVRPYTGPYKVLKRSAKYFTVVKNGKPDTVSVDRLKPAFIFDNNKTEKAQREKERVTQPRITDRKDPETPEVAAKTEEIAAETDESAARTSEVAKRDYKAALLRDMPKRKYTKQASSDVKSETFTTRSGRNSRPPSRF